MVELSSATNGKRWGLLADGIAARVRTCDRVGLLNDGRIAILLPATDRPGAQRVVADVQASLGSASILENWRILRYPANRTGQSDRQEHHTYGIIDEGLEPLFSMKVPRWKRILDITGAVVGLAVFSPLFVLVPLYLALVSPGPVFFRQQRVGYRGRLFTFIKFRTMKPNSDTTEHREYLASLIRGHQPMTKLDAPSRRDPRIIPGGNILRRLSIDEIPQFINILRGDMSLVGPRPCIPYEATEYARWHTQRFDVLPGLTGLWQVSGKNRLSFAEMVRLDNTYARTMSFWLDLKILLLTIPALFVMASEAVLDRFRCSNDRRGNS